MKQPCAKTIRTPAPWQIKARRLLVDKSPWLKVWEEEVALPNGLTIGDFLTEERREYASILALTDDNQVPLVQQYKHGLKEIIWALPAGYLDEPDEDPLLCAQRELAEETGFIAGTWHHLASPVLSSNRGTARCHLYLALAAQSNGGQHLDDTEAIRCQLFPLDEVQRMVLAGELPNISCVANFFAGLDRLRALGIVP